MSGLLDGVVTRYLPLDDYIADYTAVSDGLTGDIWKLERAQFFREPGNPSWEAFEAGRWRDAIDLAAADEPELTDHFASLADRGSHFFRVRAVETPLTDYLLWELHVLRVRASAGEKIRVVLPALLTSAEEIELVLLGDVAGYAVDYRDDGTARGAAKFVDRGAIARCTAAIRDIYGRGEDLERFFAREVAPLGAPGIQ